MYYIINKHRNETEGPFGSFEDANFEASELNFTSGDSHIDFYEVDFYQVVDSKGYPRCNRERQRNRQQDQQAWEDDIHWEDLPSDFPL